MGVFWMIFCLWFDGGWGCVEMGEEVWAVDGLLLYCRLT